MYVSIYKSNKGEQTREQYVLSYITIFRQNKYKDELLDYIKQTDHREGEGNVTSPAVQVVRGLVVDDLCGSRGGGRGKEEEVTESLSPGVREKFHSSQVALISESPDDNNSLDWCNPA